MPKVLCILTDNFEDLEAIGPIAILRRAKIDVDVATLYKNDATGKYMNHLTNLKDLSKIDYKNYDLLLLPGGPQYIVLEKDKLVNEVIKFAVSTSCHNGSISLNASHSFSSIKSSISGCKSSLSIFRSR